MAKVYEEILPDGDPQFFVDQIFRVLDGDNNGYIDFMVNASSGSLDFSFLIFRSLCLL